MADDHGATGRTHGPEPSGPRETAESTSDGGGVESAGRQASEELSAARRDSAELSAGRRTGGGKTAFEQAGEEDRISLPTEFILFLRDNKKWWLLPIVLVLALLGVFAVLAGSGAAPFIYTLF